MGRRYLHASMLLVFSTLPVFWCAPPLLASATVRYLRGMLEDHLQVDDAHLQVWTWQAATPDELHRLGLRKQDVVEAFAGECMLPDDRQRAVHGRLVAFKDGHRTAYLDLNRDGRFDPEESSLVTQAPPGSFPGSFFGAEAHFELPLAKGAYRQMPVLLALPHAQGTPAAPPGAQEVLLSGDPFVEGHLMTPSGPVLMRFAYDPARGSLKAADAQEWMDLNRDGMIDRTAASPERGSSAEKPPIFRLKNLYLRTTVLDAETRTFTMKTVPSSEYRRIEMGVGDKLPDFTFRDLAGKKRRLSDVKGTYRLLDFWASWCAPCVADLTEQKAAYERYHDKGFEILGMNGDAETEKPAQLLQKLDIHWPQARLDKEMVEKRFQIGEWPTEVLIDRHGRVVSISQPDHLPLYGKNLETTLATLLP